MSWKSVRYLYVVGPNNEIYLMVNGGLLKTFFLLFVSIYDIMRDFLAWEHEWYYILRSFISIAQLTQEMNFTSRL